MFFKGVLASLAGPAPNYDMQRILATRNPREASLMNGMVTVVLMFPRYMMIAGITVLALGFCMPELQSQAKPDFEKILPARPEPAGADRRPRLPARRAGGRVHVELRRHAQRRAGLRGQRHLQALHQSATPAAQGSGAEPDRLGRVPRHRHRLRPADEPHHRRHDVAGRRPLQRLRRRQRAQVVLVALQRLRVFLGHGRRDRRGDDRAAARRGDRRPLVQHALHLPGALRRLADRLLRRHAAEPGRRTTRC